MNTKNEYKPARQVLKKIIEDTPFGYFVKSLRECENITQAELARRMKVTRQFIHKVENGENVSLEMVLKIAKALKLPHEGFVEIYLNSMLKSAGLKEIVSLKSKAA